VPSGSLNDLPDDEGTKEDWNTDIVNKEVRNTPAALDEDRPAVEEDDETEESETGPCDIRIAMSSHWESGTIDALHLQSLGESDGCETDNPPGE